MEGGHLELVDLPGATLRAVHAQAGDDWVILLDRRLGPGERREAVVELGAALGLPQATVDLALAELGQLT